MWRNISVAEPLSIMVFLFRSKLIQLRARKMRKENSADISEGKGERKIVRIYQKEKVVLIRMKMLWIDPER